jgi:hypothetical protein
MLVYAYVVKLSALCPSVHVIL